MDLLRPSAPPASTGRFSVPAEFQLTATLGVTLLFVLVRNNGREISHLASSMYNHCRGFVRTLLVGDDDNREKLKRKETQEERRIVRHKGSCHCTAVAFYITAPRTLSIYEGTGKLPFPRTVVKAKSFVLKQGHESLRIYYLGTSTAAHTFCTQCGVHLLYAPHPQSKIIYLNVDCLQPGTFNRKVMPKQQNDYELDYLDTDEEDNEKPVSHYDYDYNHAHALENEVLDLETSFAFEKRPPNVMIPKNNELPVSSLYFPTAPEVDDNVIKSHRRRQHLASQRSKSWNIVKPPPPVPILANVAVDKHNHLIKHHSWNPTSTTMVNTSTIADDISEPTIPIDLISTADETMTSMGEVSVRSSLTEATARDLRYYMRKHIRKHDHLKRQQRHSSSSIINDAMEEEGSDFVSTSEYNETERPLT